MAKTKGAPAATKGRAKRGRKRGRAGKAHKNGFDVRALRAKLGQLMGIDLAPRNVLAKLAGVHENSVSNWERGSLPTAKKLATLRDIASRAAAGKLDLPKARRPGRRPGRPAGKRAKTAAASNGSVNVSSLRRTLGISRAAFAKLLGASDGSIFNWERGATVPNAKYVRKLAALAARAKAGDVAVPAPAPRGRGGRPAAIAGDCAVVYANQVSVARSAGAARIRFGLTVPGENGARAMADVVVPLDVLARIRS